MFRTPKICIEIPHYDFSGTDSDLFLGRVESKKRLIRRIKPKFSKDSKFEYQGCYLVSGYRGMGKTKLVDKAIEKVNKDDCIIPIHVSLSQSGLDEYQVLRQLFTEFNNSITTKSTIVIRRWLFAIKLLFSMFSFAFGIVISFYFLNEFGPKDSITSGLAVLILFSSIVNALFLQTILFGFINFFFKRFQNFESKRKSINRRLFSKLEKGSNSVKIFNGFGSGSSLINTAVEKFGNSDENYKLSYEMLSAKELEIEIKILLTLYKKIKKSKPILFIVDELDKLEPEFVEGEADYFSLGKSRRLTRKESLVKILATLKSFINTSDAKFIFIGGAELYDASLADIADRESFYSSIFHEVIYVDSFFKDFEQKKIGLTQMAELYLLKLLFGNEFNTENNYRLEYLYSKLSDLDKKYRDFLMFSIYNFTVYLTYRSNGSPKKLKELIEYHLSNYTNEDKNSGDLIFTRENKKSFRLTKASQYNIDRLKKKSFIQLSFGNQHKIGLLTLMFKPYFIANEKYLKSTNDRTLYLTAFLMDHILKFHKSAFSWKNIELAPDIIMGNQGPNLRGTVSDIIDYLSIRHIRQTSNAMYTYKFRSRIAMELRFISKISDESSAAYNFTYDESEHLKSFFKRKLKQKLETYSNSAYQNNDTNILHSIMYLNSTIADIHYYDEEYNPAIRYYLDSIQHIRDMYLLDKTKLSRHQKMIFTRNRLKLSLCYEKSMKYDSAYSTVRSIMLDLKDEGLKTDSEIIPFGVSLLSSTESTNKKTWESPYKRMQLYLRPFLALLILIEKDRSDGITVSNLRRNVKDYTDFLEVEELFPGKNFRIINYRNFTKNKSTRVEAKADHKRIQTLLSDYYQNVGSILFFKNKIYKSLHDEYSYFIWETWLNLSDMEDKAEPIKIEFSKDQKDCRSYASLSEIKNHLGITGNYFHPSYTAFSYYFIALGHILIPYVENVIRMDGPDKNFNSNKQERFNHFELLNKFAIKPKYEHILNGGQQFNLAVISSKLGDSILGSASEISDFNSIYNTFDDLLNSDILEEIFYKNLAFKKLFRLNSIIFFYTRSYKLFDQSGFYYDALFQLKKILYILRSHKSSSTKKPKIGYYHLALIISREAKKYATNKGLCIKSMKENLYRDVYNIDKDKEPFHNSFLLESTDIMEIRILSASIDSRLDSDLILDLESNIPNIRSIYIKIQTLRYIFDYKIKQITHSIVEQENIVSIFLLLQNYIKTYDFNYIMSYTYYASLCDKMSQFLKKYDTTLDTKISFNDLSTEATEYYKKAIRLHSEGKEYKSFIQQMYVLDDDFNDSLVHFSAALERSLMNTQFISERICELTKTNQN